MIPMRMHSSRNIPHQKSRSDAELLEYPVDIRINISFEKIKPKRGNANALIAAIKKAE